MKSLLILLVVFVIVCCQTPPTWPVRFQQDFVESYSTSQMHTAGKLWFDSERGMERMDRNNGRFDPICGSISNMTTPCTQLTREGKRYIYFHLIRQCCYCCDSEHGCGPMRRDWLKDAKFVGKEDISGQTFNHFSVADAQT